MALILGLFLAMFAIVGTYSVYRLVMNLRTGIAFIYGRPFSRSQAPGSFWFDTIGAALGVLIAAWAAFAIMQMM